MNEIKPNHEDLIAWWVYVVVGLVSLLLLSGGHQIEKEYPTIAIFMKELAFAGVIALILIGTIERFSRARHQRAADALVERININLFHAIYERYIPHVVFSEVEKALLRSNVLRKDHEVYYTLEPLNNDDDRKAGPPCDKYIKCIIQANYKLKNITARPITHTVKLNLERPSDKDFVGRCKITDVSIDNIALTADKIEDQTTLTPIQICFKHDVAIKPEETILVSTRAELVKRSLDQEIWTSMLPSDGFKLSVTVPMKNLEVQAHALHMEEVETIMSNEVTKVWKLPYGMFPFQSVVFWWHPKQASDCPIAQ